MQYLWGNRGKKRIKRSQYANVTEKGTVFSRSSPRIVPTVKLQEKGGTLKGKRSEAHYFEDWRALGRRISSGFGDVTHSDHSDGFR